VYFWWLCQWVDMDLQCMSWQPYILVNLYPSGALRPLKIVNKSLVVLCRCSLPIDPCLFPWSIYKVLHLSPCSNLVLWGAICYTIFSHLSSYPDNEPTSCLVTWTLCLSVTPPHIPKYLTHLCLVIRQVSSSNQNLEILKIHIFLHRRTLLTVNLRQCRILLVDKPRRWRFVQFLKIFRDFSRNLEVSKLFPSFVDLGCEIHFSWDLSYPL